MTAARSATATFDLVQRSLTVAKEGPGLGRVTGSGINCGDGSTDDCSQSYDHGTDVHTDGGAQDAGWAPRFLDRV